MWLIERPFVSCLWLDHSVSEAFNWCLIVLFRVWIYYHLYPCSKAFPGSSFWSLACSIIIFVTQFIPPIDNTIFLTKDQRCVLKGVRSDPSVCWNVYNGTLCAAHHFVFLCSYVIASSAPKHLPEKLPWNIFVLSVTTQVSSTFYKPHSSRCVAWDLVVNVASYWWANIHHGFPQGWKPLHLNNHVVTC